MLFIVAQCSLVDYASIFRIESVNKRIMEHTDRNTCDSTIQAHIKCFKRNNDGKEFLLDIHLEFLLTVCRHTLKRVLTVFGYVYVCNILLSCSYSISYSIPFRIFASLSSHYFCLSAPFPFPSPDIHRSAVLLIRELNANSVREIAAVSRVHYISLFNR